MRVGAIDIGTNTVLLLIAEWSPSGLSPVLDVATITRLGESVDRTRKLSAIACHRTLGCLERYGQLLADHGVDHVAAVGTSALRDAAGAPEFLDAAEQTLGTRPRVIAGALEAALTCEGALSDLRLRGSVTVFDVGGGSTELIEAEATDAGVTIGSWKSLDVGSVRLYERHVRGDPPGSGELESVREDIRRALAEWPASGCPEVVGVAGTVTTLSALAHELPSDEPHRVHGSTLKLAEVDELAGQLAQLPLARRRALPGLEPGRADVIVVGALLVRELLLHLGAGALRVSERGVRWGLAQRLGHGNW